MVKTCGGRVSVVLNGINYSARGIIKLFPSSISVKSGVNQDGSVYRTTEPKARRAELTFDRMVDDNGTLLVWDERVMQQVNFGCTFIEQDTNLTQLLTGAFFEGDPQIDTATGEVSGVNIAAQSYNQVGS